MTFTVAGVTKIAEAYAGPEGDREYDAPLNNHKTIGVFSNTGPESLKKNHKAAKSAFNVGSSTAHQRNAIEMFLSPHNQLRKCSKLEKKLSKLDPTDKTYRIRA